MNYIGKDIFDFDTKKFETALIEDAESYMKVARTFFDERDFDTCREAVVDAYNCLLNYAVYDIRPIDLGTFKPPVRSGRFYDSFFDKADFVTKTLHISLPDGSAIAGLDKLLCFYTSGLQRPSGQEYSDLLKKLIDQFPDFRTSVMAYREHLVRTGYSELDNDYYNRVCNRLVGNFPGVVFHEYEEFHKKGTKSPFYNPRLSEKMFETAFVILIFVLVVASCLWAIHNSSNASEALGLCAFIIILGSVFSGIMMYVIQNKIVGKINIIERRNDTAKRWKS